MRTNSRYTARAAALAHKMHLRSVVRCTLCRWHMAQVLHRHLATMY